MSDFRPQRVFRAAVLTAAAFGALLALSGCGEAKKEDGRKTAAPTVDRVELTPEQAKSVAVGVVGQREFSSQRVAVGAIDFNEDRSVQVFSNYQGKIVEAFAQLGDDVKKGQRLYTINSPDLIQAESTLIAAAGVYELTTKNLERMKRLNEIKGVADKDYQQAVSDQMTADGALRAAKSAVHVYGKSEADIEKTIKTRHVDPILVVASPISGHITARNGQPGLFVQPGNAPAPYAVADLGVKWMVANVPEVDSVLYHKGQKVQVKVQAYGDRTFTGSINALGTAVDPNTRTLVVRADIADPKNELRPGMFASFIIETGHPVTSVAVPLAAVVREGDGSMNVWTTTDNRHFIRKTVVVGVQRDGWDEIVKGLAPGEQVVTEGAVFLSNMLNAASAND
ncbi:MAG: efflux RND transporter periplasmic adaptor subunit [Pseudomonadota bacterium]|jgi:cobalt-zinc-cadmium efflux system membrane fusion protein